MLWLHNRKSDVLSQLELDGSLVSTAVERRESHGEEPKSLDVPGSDKQRSAVVKNTCPAQRSPMAKLLTRVDHFVRSFSDPLAVAPDKLGDHTFLLPSQALDEPPSHPCTRASSENSAHDASKRPEGTLGFAHELHIASGDDLVLTPPQVAQSQDEPLTPLLNSAEPRTCSCPVVTPKANSELFYVYEKFHHFASPMTTRPRSPLLCIKNVEPELSFDHGSLNDPRGAEQNSLGLEPESQPQPAGAASPPFSGPPSPASDGDPGLKPLVLTLDLSTLLGSRAPHGPAHCSASEVLALSASSRPSLNPPTSDSQNTASVQSYSSTAPQILTDAAPQPLIQGMSDHCDRPCPAPSPPANNQLFLTSQPSIDIEISDLSLYPLDEESSEPTSPEPRPGALDFKTLQRLKDPEPHPEPSALHLHSTLLPQTQISPAPQPLIPSATQPFEPSAPRAFKESSAAESSTIAALDGVVQRTNQLLDEALRSSLNFLEVSEAEATKTTATQPLSPSAHRAHRREIPHVTIKLGIMSI